jgi:hypothetical protein
MNELTKIQAGRDQLMELLKGKHNENLEIFYLDSVIDTNYPVINTNYPVITRISKALLMFILS